MPLLTFLQVSTELWASPFVHRPGRFRALFQANNFFSAVCDTASSGRRRHTLVIQGCDVEDLALKFVAKVKAAAVTGDFTPVLSTERTFNVVAKDGRLVSTGAGIKREVIYTAFRMFSNDAGRWLLPRFDDKCLIATTMPLASARFVSGDRLVDLTVLGFLCALMLMHGIAPEPLSPSLIYFAANGCDPQCLDEAWIGEWHPALRALLNQWKATGPYGDLAPFQAHFATYHDMQIASFNNRDSVQHNQMGKDMLYASIIGPQPPEHDELKAFFTGIRAPCANGFDFMEASLFLCWVAHSCPGGPSTYISQIWTSLIHDFQSLEPHLTIVDLPRQIIDQLAGAGSPIRAVDLPLLLTNFLKGRGVPCPTLLDSAKDRLSRLIPFDTTDSPAFRSRALCWATTGCPHVESEDHKTLTVQFVGPDDTGYHPLTDVRQAGMKFGQISYRTCFRIARIPVVHLIDLCSRSYPTIDADGNETEPRTLEQAIKHWLFIEILAGIGGHSMI
ncbi:hypothetical protein FB45DRAFT_842981 [Roridomyces roridus]|uniref:Uncharacterized protein n=1 Tax=Roridomyces roridus TaxID=1738132 RepID=A0AAD7B8G9_9AGAR|nr:hypothetical protein FB45DRAFT_842981 [Roridomyces roridus]